MRIRLRRTLHSVNYAVKQKPPLLVSQEAGVSKFRICSVYLPNESGNTPSRALSPNREKHNGAGRAVFMIR